MQGQRNRVNAACLLAAFALCISPRAASAQPEDGLTGIWRNPGNSVHVQIAPCGEAVCGVVVWASGKAKEDARAGGTAQLTGTNLLRDFVAVRDGTWRGTVFVPDLGRTVSGTITLTGPATFRARSCALGVFCRTQVWQRAR